MYLWFLRYWAWQTEFFGHSGPFFPLSPPPLPPPSYGQKIKILKKWKKNTWRYYHFRNEYHKWQSYDEWFFRYGMQWTQYLVIWTVFCPFSHLTTQKIKIFKKWENNLDILSFYRCVPKMTIIWCTFPKIRKETGRIFCLFGSFFALFPPTTQKIKILKSWKKYLQILSFCTSAP